ncbi:MAG: response regulator transcription factor [Anaerolineae bacterium]|nr:MAG: response regulator transcription factor [Anaerolineae bacterium]
MAMRVLLAEDHKIVRQGTRLYLESVGIEVVGEAANGHEAIQLVRQMQPDVVVMDIHMPDLTGIEATRRIRHENEDVRVLVLTAYDNPTYVQALLNAGADGFVLKTAEFAELHRALKEVYVGRSAFDPQIVEKAARLNEELPAFVEDLTDREIEVLRHAAQGLTNKRIGEILFISDRTVQGHLQRIYRKLNVTTRTEAVTTALGQGYITLDEEDNR